MEDTEWERAANKLLDSLDQVKAEDIDKECGEDSIEKIGAFRNREVNEQTIQTASHVLSPQEVKKEDPIKNFNDLVLEKIQHLDPQFNLTIHRYLNQLNDDPIVLEYGRKLVELQFVPSEPSVVELKHYATQALQDFDLPFDCQKNCIFMLVSFFKCCETKRMLKMAENEKVALFEVTAVPEFIKSQVLFTTVGHERLSALRDCLCIQMQRAAAIENQFVMELLLIRICYCVMKELQQTKGINESDGTELVKAYFYRMYVRVKYEYKESNSKEMEAETLTNILRTEHNLPVYPSWRIREESPPRFFEKDLSEKILNLVQKSNFHKFDTLKAIDKLWS